MSRLLAVAWLVLAWPGAVAADSPATGTPAGDAVGAEEQEVAAQRAALAGEMADLRSARESATGPHQEALAQAVALLESLDLLYEHRLAALRDAAPRAAAVDKAERELAALHSGGLRKPPPYGIRQLDKARQQRDAAVNRAEIVAVGMRVAEDALVRATEQRDDRERARRAAKEALETNNEPANAPALEDALLLRKLESRAATAQVRLREQELRNERLAADAQRLRAALLGEKVVRMAPDTRFAPAELDEVLAKVDGEKTALSRSLQAAKAELAAAERLWARAKERAAGEESGRSGSEEVEARRLAQLALRTAVTVRSEQMQRLADVVQAWKRRYDVDAAAAPRAALAAWEKDARAALAEIEQKIRAQRARLSELQSDRLGRSETLYDAAVPAEVGRWIREQERQLDEQIRILETSLAWLEDARQLHANLLRELHDRLGTLTLGERVRQAWETARAVWGYEILAVDDRPITVGKVAAALLIFFLGLALARRLSRLLGRRVFPRVGLEAGVIAALESLSYYVLVSLLLLLALRIVNVPLTAFTILGGALAIGVGFGSQNIVNNFISGLILFAERPIRIGDLIEVDGTYGTVEHIGARSTRVRSATNIHIIVPNSAFLEKNVVNWTLSDDQVRTMVQVGVAYGSPTRDVARLMRQAVDEQGKILRTPEPVVFFADFGDSALVFEVHFWIRMRTLMERRIIESELRYRIDELFREAGITIAFPQRDVHLDAARPLEVRVVPSP